MSGETVGENIEVPIAYDELAEITALATADVGDDLEDVPIEVLARCDAYCLELLDRMARSPEGQALLAELEREGLRTPVSRRDTDRLLGRKPPGTRLAHGVVREDLAHLARCIQYTNATETWMRDLRGTVDIDTRFVW